MMEQARADQSCHQKQWEKPGKTCFKIYLKSSRAIEVTTLRDQDSGEVGVIEEPNYLSQFIP